MKATHIIIVLILITALNGYIYYKNSQMDSANLTVELDAIKASATTQYQGRDNELDLGDLPIDKDETLTDIVVSADDVKRSDVTESIGRDNPFNNKYITEEDIEESLERILSDDDKRRLMDEEMEYLRQLRHTEMIQQITEDNSNIKNKAVELIEKDAEEAVEFIEKDAEEGGETQ